MTMIQFLGEWAVRSSILLLAGALLLWLLRVNNPSIRLAACTAMLAASLAIPLLTLAVPKLPLAVMPAPVQRPAVAPLALTGGTVAILPRPVVPESISPPAPPQPVNAKPFPWMRLAAILYALATVALLLRLFAGLFLSLRVLHRSRPTGMMAEGTEVRESNCVESPVTIGVLRPAVLLPIDWRDWGSAKLDAVLAHERSHIRRRDPAVQFVSAVHRSLLWASPSSWLLDRSIVRTAELISDDDAIAAIRDRVSYAEILLEFVQRAGQAHSLGVPMARYERPEKRIRRILNSTAISGEVTRRGIAAILLLGAPLAYLAAAAHPQSTPRPAPLAVPIPLAPAEPTERVPAATPTPTEATATTPGPTPTPEQVAEPQSQMGPEPKQQSSGAQDPIAAAELPRFEVASIKSPDPNDKGPRLMGVRVHPGGRVTISYLPLKTLIAAAFGLSYWQISGGDAWMGNDLYLVEAKPPDAMQSSIKDLRYTNFEIEDKRLREMLQALLIDRFQLDFHREAKTGDVYLLEPNGKPLRLRPTEIPAAPPAERGSFGSIGYVDARWGIFATSMPQLAKFASSVILHVPVLDRTELSGSFDYRQRDPDLEPVYGGDQSDSFRHYLSEAGLKLERAEGPVEYFVIDHAAKPSPD